MTLEREFLKAIQSTMVMGSKAPKNHGRNMLHNASYFIVGPTNVFPLTFHLPSSLSCVSHWRRNRDQAERWQQRGRSGAAGWHEQQRYRATAARPAMTLGGETPRVAMALSGLSGGDGIKRWGGPSGNSAGRRGVTSDDGAGCWSSSAAPNQQRAPPCGQPLLFSSVGHPLLFSSVG